MKQIESTLIKIMLGLLATTIVAGVYILSTHKTPVAVVAVPKVIDNRAEDVQDLAKSNGFSASNRIVNSILNASNQYKIDAMELTAIAIVETGLGKYAHTRKNSNGTVDRGLFQINTVNESKCVEYNLDSPEGSALCAAKLLSQIKTKHSDYVGRYHSKTPTKKAKYIQKVSQVLASADR